VAKAGFIKACALVQGKLVAEAELGFSIKEVRSHV